MDYEIQTTRLQAPQLSKLSVHQYQRRTLFNQLCTRRQCLLVSIFGAVIVTLLYELIDYFHTSSILGSLVVDRSERVDLAPPSQCHTVLNWRHVPPISNHLSESTKSSPTPFITVNFKGRIGNLMFQYASLLGISNMTNHIPVIPSHLEIVSYFQNIKRTVPSCSDPLLSAKRNRHFISKLEEDEPKSFDTNLIELLRSNLSENNAEIDGYLQSWKYFDHISDYIRSQFRFDPQMSQPVIDYIQHLKSGYNVTQVIGLHIRRGDYINNPELYAVADKGYLLKAMNYFSERYNRDDIMFIICSTDDGLKWFEDMIEPELANYKFVYSRGNEPIEDFILLSFTDHMIMTVGTFGWWPSYFTPGEVVYYRNIWGDVMSDKQRELLNNFFPSYWISL